mmetsp:Transcript_21253/g.51375  ORF Transcript_21253/g.51375 Transcript_21253/m.51375 type:complete len:811 (+) Transcript_21253:136-2568(+)
MFGETKLLQHELTNEYSYRVDAVDSQYDFNHVTQQAPPSAYMRAGGAGASRMAGAPASRGGFGRNIETARPVTSNRAAGYTAAPTRGGGGQFDPFNQGGEDPVVSTAPALAKNPELSPEDKLRNLEKEIHKLVEESAVTREAGDIPNALEKAKEAAKKERQLYRLREQYNLLEQLNVDLTFSVCLNLAIHREANGSDQEALIIYNQIVKNKQYPYSGRFRVNMGNVYFHQGKYLAAIKMYRMALDQIPNNVQAHRFKIMRNIGHAFFKMHQFTDAIDSYENLLMHDGEHLDFMTGFHLMLCYYALGDKEKMKRGYVKLLNIQQAGLEDFEDDEVDDLLAPDAAGGGSSPAEKMDRTLTEGDDALREDVKRRQRDAARYIVNASNLIAPVIEATPIAGYGWIIEALNAHGFPGIASELEIAKASHYLRRKEFDMAIEVLKGFEKKEPSLMARASTNLSFLYFLEQNFAEAEKFADMAVKADRYNARALVNKGNCLFVSAEFERAKEVYLEAIGVSADCLEAIYNLGLVNMHVGKYTEALLAFDKLHSITHANCEVMWQLGDIHDRLGNDHKAHEWFSLLITSPKGRPTDPGVLARIANLCHKAEDETQAFHYHLESYRHWPVDMNVITWLGIYYVKQEMYEAAIPFFHRAAEIQPDEVKWLLMVASCYRRMGVYHRALKLYEDIHRQHPQEVECLRYLITICKEMGLKYEHYAAELKKLERMQESANPLPDEDKAASFGATGQQEIRHAQQSPPRDSGPPPGSQPEALFEANVADPGVQSKQSRRLLATGPRDDDDDWGNEELGDDLLPGM